MRTRVVSATAAAWVAAVQCVRARGVPHRHADGRAVGVSQVSAGHLGAAPPGTRHRRSVYGLNCFPDITDADCTHTAIATGGGVPDLGHPIFWWVNTMLGNVKNALHGTYHALCPKYLQRYLSEFCYRFNRRFDLARFGTASHCRCGAHAADELSPRNLGCVIWEIRMS